MSQDEYKPNHMKQLETGSNVSCWRVGRTQEGRGSGRKRRSQAAAPTACPGSAAGVSLITSTPTNPPSNCTVALAGQHLQYKQKERDPGRMVKDSKPRTQIKALAGQEEGGGSGPSQSLLGFQVHAL